jgi:hypothetical protein
MNKNFLIPLTLILFLVLILITVYAYNLSNSSSTPPPETNLNQNQPHISSGRIPSDKGYRYFIDNLLSRSKTDLDYQKRLELELLKLKTKNARLERTTAKLLASMSEVEEFVRV